MSDTLQLVVVLNLDSIQQEPNVRYASNVDTLQLVVEIT